MTQPGERLCLAFETSPQIKFAGKIFWKDFDSDKTVEAGFIDLSHSPGADRRDDFVGTEFYSRGQQHTVAQAIEFAIDGGP